jgi:serine/threonine-protein kinase
VRLTTQSADDPPPLGGERFARYLLVGEIAHGGMGEVFLAVHQGLEGFSKVVVVKRLLQHLTTESQFTRMFIEEARLSARMEHANIVKTYEFGEHDGRYYTVMEFLAGEDLGKVRADLQSRSAVMPLSLAVYIAGQLCAGLHFAHELTDLDGHPLGLVHRDVSPANVIITYAGEVKIIDFGVAKVDTAAVKTATGMLKGKFAYMSPEYIRSRGLDRRADVFSAGIVLWELLTGRELFGRDTTAGTIFAVMEDPIPPPSEYRPEVPPQLDAIVARALARAPADRFETADELRSALDEVAASLPKVDGRELGRMMEDLFGTQRANAMSSITQSRLLAHNIPLVMKCPAVMPTSTAATAVSPSAQTTATATRRSRWWLVAGGTLAGALVAIAALELRSKPAPPAEPPARPQIALAPVAPVDAAPIDAAPVDAEVIAAPPPPVPAIADGPPRPAVSAPHPVHRTAQPERVTPGAASGSSAPAAPPAPVGSSGSAVPANNDAPHDLPSVAGSSADRPSEPGSAAVATRPEVTAPAPPPVDAAKQREQYSAALRVAMRAQSGPIEQCYERAKMDDSNLRGKVVVQIAIAPDGSVKTPGITSSTLGSLEVEGCITREVAHFQLPRPLGGTTIAYTYTFVF